MSGGALPRRLSAGFVVVRRTATGWRYLVLRAFQSWDFPKGVVEPDECPLAAARRETAEETTLTDLELPWGEGFRETAPYGRGKVARYHLALSPRAVVTLPVSEALGRPEHHEFRWVDAIEARALLPPRLQPIFSWAQSVVEAGDP